MSLSVLNAISPIDGRYRSKVTELESFFSEQALIKYRILIEIEYFIALCEAKIDQLSTFDEKLFVELRLIYDNFSTEDAIQIKNIENNLDTDTDKYLELIELEECVIAKRHYHEKGT